MLYKDVTKELYGAKSMLVMHKQFMSMLKALFFFLLRRIYIFFID